MLEQKCIVFILQKNLGPTGKKHECFIFVQILLLQLQEGNKWGGRWFTCIPYDHRTTARARSVAYFTKWNIKGREFIHTFILFAFATWRQIIVLKFYINFSLVLSLQMEKANLKKVVVEQFLEKKQHNSGFYHHPWHRCVWIGDTSLL